MILCDTNILIHAFNGRVDTIEQLNKVGWSEIVLSSITVMELFQGMGNKNELVQMKKKIQYYDIVQIDKPVSETAIEFIEKYKLSHGLQIPDAIIAATAIVHNRILITGDSDFKNINGLQVIDPYSL